MNVERHPARHCHARRVEEQSVRIVRRRGDLVISETKHGFVCANAGVDLSNVDEGWAALLPDDSDRGEAVVYVDQRRRLVSRCLDRLSARQRAAIVLTYYEELPNAEAAVTLGLKVKAFESLLLRARQKLAAALSAEGLISSGGIQ